jgi:hypothetical protein
MIGSPSGNVDLTHDHTYMHCKNYLASETGLSGQRVCTPPCRQALLSSHGDETALLALPDFLELLSCTKDAGEPTLAFLMRVWYNSESSAYEQQLPWLTPSESVLEPVYGLDMTGVAGPESQEDRPAGTVVVAIEGTDGVFGLGKTRTKPS